MRRKCVPRVCPSKSDSDHENNSQREKCCSLRSTASHTHLRIHNLKKGVSENEAPGPVGAYTTTHNNTPTQLPERESRLLTATFDQECSFCREESGLWHAVQRNNRIRSVRIPTTMPERSQAVKSTAARTPCRGIAGRDESPRHNRTHAPTGPRKARTYIGR